MPRKPNPAPAIFRLEGLSDGIDRRLVDDFSGEVIPQPIKPKADPQLAIDAGKRLVRDNQRAMLAAVMPQVMGQPIKPKAEPRLVAPNIPGKRAIVVGGFALLMDKPGWRR